MVGIPFCGNKEDSSSSPSPESLSPNKARNEVGWNFFSNAESFCHMTVFNLVKKKVPFVKNFST